MYTHTHVRLPQIDVDVMIVIIAIITAKVSVLIRMYTCTIPYWQFNIEKTPKMSYAKPLLRAVIFLQTCFRLPKRCSYHLPLREGGQSDFRRRIRPVRV